MSDQIIVFDRPQGGDQLSFPELIGKGGEGAVYASLDPKWKKIVVKIFSDDKLRGDGEKLYKKISNMVKIGNKNSNRLIRKREIAWPQLVVYNKKGKFAGYAMKRVKGATLNRLAHPMVYKEHFPDMDREKVTKMLIKLWRSVEMLHKCNVFVGDVNLRNVICSKDYIPCWIDVDSFQVNEWHCTVGRPEMTPPEHLNKPFSNVVRTSESDLFSMAVLTFQCLMLGRHPYDVIGGSKPVDNLRKGHFPYQTGGAPPAMAGGVPIGPWHKIWSHYTYNLKNLFVDAFVGGASNPSKRPTAKKWIDGLNHYIYTLNHVNHDELEHSREMIPKQPKPKDLPFPGKAT